MSKNFDEEIERCKQLIRKSYEELSLVRHVTNSREYSRSTDSGLDFIHIYLRHSVPKLWFTDPTHVPDVFCSQLGRHIAIGEEDFLVKKIFEDSVPPTAFDFQVESLKSLVRRFEQEGHSNPVVFAPIRFFTPLAIEGAVSFECPHHLQLNGRTIPLVYSSKYVDFDKFIIIDKSFGTWIYKQGNVNDYLTVEVKPIEGSEDIDILVVTKVFYQKENRNAIRIIEPNTLEEA